jgi:oxygen-independent coproporphyrinogen-3 oxidase
MSALYVHLPFCKKKCNYCDFASYAGKEHLIDEYVNCLIRELTTPSFFLPLSKEEKSERSEDRGGWETIFFGGGTPTLLEPEHFDKILNSLPSPVSTKDPHPLPGGEGSFAEISIEANPGTADKNKLKELRRLGINRLSIGAQTFSDHHLKQLGRIHSSQEIIRFYDDARAVGFENISLDLIFALPDQTLEEWKADLMTAVSLAPDHLSTYNLQIEAGTPLHSQHMRKKLPLPSEETELAMYELTIKVLWMSGFKHYEISNFARPGFQCRHNINYWQNGNYLGIGAGAHSHVNGQRWANPSTIEEYLKTPSSFLPLSKGENVERSETRGGETIFMGLRLLDGLHEEKFAGFDQELAELFKDGFLAKENSHIKLTRKGLHLANLVFEKFV